MVSYHTHSCIFLRANNISGLYDTIIMRSYYICLPEVKKPGRVMIYVINWSNSVFTKCKSRVLWFSLYVLSVFFVDL